MTSQEEMNERMKRNPHIVERVIAAFENDEWVEVEIEEGDPEKDPKLFLAWLIEGMKDDWENSAWRSM